MKATTYVKLLKVASEKGITLGKLLNQILNEYIERYEMGKVASEVVNKNEQL